MCLPAARWTSVARTCVHKSGNRAPAPGSAAPISYPSGGRCQSKISRLSPPEHAVLQTEFPRQRGQHGRMAKGIGGIQHVQPPAETLRIGGAKQEVADE